MMKKWVLAVALLSLAISMGCRNGLTGVSKVKVVVSDAGNLSILYVTQVVQFTATVTGTSNTAVTWSMTADIACTGTPNPCGTLTPSGNTASYVAPATSPGNNVNITITATSQADSTISDSLSVKVHQITVVITPISPNVGVILTQQFIAVALPDDAPQTFTWSQPTCTTSPCGTIAQDPNNPALAVYKAPGTPSPANDVKFIATSTVDTTGFTQATVTVVKSRLLANSTYAFRFSGFNNLGATARAGSFVVAADGATISSGVADELTTGGPQHCPTVTGSYSPASNDSNNQGTVILNLCGASNTYTAVLDANGDIQVIESDNNGTGSGVIEPFTGKFKDNTSLSGPFVFGFAGVDSAGKRVGYVGVANMDGLPDGLITSGLIDTNDNGTAGSASDLIGTYSMANGVGTMSLTSPTLGKSFSFELYGVSGQLTGKDPATLYAINTDPIGNNSAVSGTVVFQDPAGAPYNTSTFKNGNTSVVSLTGVDSTGTNSNVSLTLATTDGAGNLSGNFDQNNAGTIVSVSTFSTGYTYAGTGSGRYTFQLLGNPNAPVVPPVPFVLYASGANKGFLLDQSSTSVMTGIMVLQSAPKAQAGIFAASNIPGTYAAATTSSATKFVDPIAANLLLTWANPTQGVSGNQYDSVNPPPGVAVTGAYTLQGGGFGALTLTAPSAESFVIYTIDITHLLAMDVDKGSTNASIINAQQ